MINPKTMSIHFIDFEDGRTLDSKEISAHNAMGFHPPLGCSAQEADWFAVSRVLACLCYANTSICMLSPDHWIRVKNNISKKFGMEYINLLKDVESRCPCASGVSVVPELLRTLVFARPCGGDQFAAGTVSPSLDMSR